MIAVRAFYWLRQQSALSFGKHILPNICNAKICKGLNILNVLFRAHMPPGQFAVLPLRHRGSSQTWACQHPSFAQQETSNIICALQSKSTLVAGWILRSQNIFLLREGLQWKNMCAALDRKVKVAFGGQTVHTWAWFLMMSTWCEGGSGTMAFPCAKFTCSLCVYRLLIMSSANLTDWGGQIKDVLKKHPSGREIDRANKQKQTKTSSGTTSLR